MSKYQELKDELAKGETCWPWSDTIRSLLADLERAEKALDDAATSLETISRLAGKERYPNGDVTCMGSFPEVRGYAISRAGVARAALSQIAGGGEQA